MNDGDVIVLHCQVKRRLLVLRVNIKDVKQQEIYQGCKLLCYLIPCICIGFVLQEELDKTCVSSLCNWMENTGFVLERSPDTLINA